MNAGDTPVVSNSGLLSTVAWQLDGQPAVYALEGGAFVCGAAVQWLRDQLGIIQSAPEVETLAQTVDDAVALNLFPRSLDWGRLTGRRKPAVHWIGLTRGSGRGEIARATLDAMALQNADILNAMEKDIGSHAVS